MRIHDVKQGSDEWLKLRCGVPTASEFHNIITPTLKISEGAGVETYLYRKLAEKWLGQPLDAFNAGAMEQGKILEEEAIPHLEWLGWEVERVGFITTDDGRYGCSPDCLLPGGGAEIKCPLPQTHIGYLLKGELPRDYAPQVHGSMLVTGRPWWKFVSYRRNLPLFVLVVERDEKVMARMREAIDAFNVRFDAAWQVLIDLNGGAPKPRNYTTKVEDDGTEVKTLMKDEELFQAFLDSPFSA